MIQTILHTDLLTFLGYVSLVFSLLAISIIVYHWRFFNRVEKSEISKRMMLVFMSDLIMYTSIALYGLNWVLMDGGSEWWLILKFIQVGAIIFNLYALIKLARFYMKVK